MTQENDPVKFEHRGERNRMSSSDQKVVLCFFILTVVICTGCKTSSEVGSNTTNTPETSKAGPAKPNPDGTIPSGSGVEKEKPAPGTGNVQGKVFYNEKPAANIQVRLCEKFNRFMGGCEGKTFTSSTDSEGEYLIKNVPPGIYEGLTAQVFETNYYVFATSGIVQAAKYRIEDGQTYFAPNTHLFKSDLKIVSPKAGSKIPSESIEVKWDNYPDAAYYKFSIHPDSGSGAETNFDYINKRIDGQSYILDKPLTAGSYRVKVTAFNSNDTKLAESPSDIEFIVEAK